MSRQSSTRTIMTMGASDHSWFAWHGTHPERTTPPPKLEAATGRQCVSRLRQHTARTRGWQRQGGGWNRSRLSTLGCRTLTSGSWLPVSPSKRWGALRFCSVLGARTSRVASGARRTVASQMRIRGPSPPPSPTSGTFSGGWGSAIKRLWRCWVHTRWGAATPAAAVTTGRGHVPRPPSPTSTSGCWWRCRGKRRSGRGPSSTRTPTAETS
mmetsp:Transcript_1865/g.3336  ORF Transcript_1865/g.3336 Transcript_1865/m.3336 type:complete len:211 (-) Transcript_1865:46-678(-)